MPKCRLIKENGERCCSNAMKGSQFCYRHNPAISEEEKRVASSRGGVSNRSRVDTPLGEVKLDSVGDVLRLLELVTREMLNGRLDQRVASTTGYLMNVSLRALESDDLEKRLERLEETLSIKPAV